MDKKMIYAKYHVHKDTGCNFRYVRSDTELFRPHCHDFYEFFMVKQGDAHHIVNDRYQILAEGNLLFIRDFDYHDYKRADNKYFEFLNLAVSAEMMKSVFEYLGDDFPKEEFLNSAMPPMVTLPVTEREKFFYRLNELNQTGDAKTVRLKLKTLLVDIFTNYFLTYSAKTSNVPLWLEMTYEKMKNPKNFISGVERMYEISGRSREHLCRSLKEHYNTTPSVLVNDLRLEYCANLLINSNLSVTDICYSGGYDNLSWFYKVFCNKYGVTPSKYRKNKVVQN